MKYKTWEAFKMLTENPELKFRLVDGKHPNSYLMAISKEFKNGYICYVDEKGYPDSVCGEISINDKWELVQQEISFTEAVKARESGKTIYCKIDEDEIIENNKFIYTPQQELYDEKHHAISANEILKGHWYIKED